MLVVDDKNNVFDVKELGKGVYVTNLYNHQHTNQVCSIGKEFDLDGTERDLTIEDVEQAQKRLKQILEDVEKQKPVLAELLDMVYYSQVVPNPMEEEN